MKLSNAALLLLTGITVGAIAGLLLAPEEGTETRKKLWKKSKKFKKDFEDRAAEYKEKASDIRDKIVSAANDVKKNFS
jgi:gas vesicle protein